MLIAASDVFRDFFLPDPVYIIRLVAAVLLGGLIGLEREVRDKPAGLRTIILICVGACIFTILSQVLGGPDWNSTRIAAQIVTGIGFLGAGAILRDRGSVIGLTTAATIWAVAAIGMAVGFGHLVLAGLGTIMILIALVVFDVVEKWIGRLYDIQEYSFIAPNEANALERVSAMFDEAGLKTRKRHCYEDESSLVFRVIAMGSKADHERLRMTLVRSSEHTLRR